MRKILRNMARAKMAQRGYDSINKRMRYHWRDIVKAYPTNVVTGKKMPKDFHGSKRNRKGSTSSLFIY